MTNRMIYGSVCSGIEAASVAWEPLGWEPAFFSEIEAFPRSVLAHHYPSVPLHGDFTTINDGEYAAIDLLVGGTPCQAFSVAGLRGGFNDQRGNLTLEFVRLAQRLRPRWVVWENVPGVLSIDRGRAFGAFLGGLAELGYGFAYRVLDAQHFGVPQRRRRVFVVGYLGDWRRAATVLFERHSLSGDFAPRRGQGQSVAGTLETSVGDWSRSEPGEGIVPVTVGLTCGDRGISVDQAAAGMIIPCGIDASNEVSHALTASHTATGRLAPSMQTFVVHGTQDPDVSVNLAHSLGRNHGQENAVCVTGDITHTLRAEGFDASEDGTGRGAPIVSVALRGREGGGSIEIGGEQSNALRASQGGGDKAHVFTGSAVRRLTPVECERLQGFPDNYTLVPHRGKLAADGPRYRALGNSMAVPVMRWIGERIQIVEDMTRQAGKEAAA